MGVFGVVLLTGGTLAGCDDSTLTDDGGSTTGSSSSSTGAGSPACEERIIYGAGQFEGVASYGESVVYVRQTDKFLPPSIVISDLLTGEDRVLVEGDDLGQYSVLGEDLYFLLGDQLRSKRLDGSGDALITTLGPGTELVDLEAEAGGVVTWLEAQGGSTTVRRWQNGTTADYPGDFTRLTRSDAGGVIASTNVGYLFRIDESGVTPLPGNGYPFLVRDGFVYLYRFDLDVDLIHYTRVDLATGDTFPLFDTGGCCGIYQNGVATATGYLAPTTSPEFGPELLTQMPYAGGEPKVILEATSQQHFNGVAQTDKYIVLSVAGPGSQIRAICRDQLPL